MGNIQKKIKQTNDFVSEGIWRVETHTLSPYKKTSIKVLRVLIISIKGYIEDKINLRASSLTFYSLLSIVPVFAMAFGIAKGFGLDQVLEDYLRKGFEGQQEVIEWSVSFARSYLKTVKSGIITGVSLIVLLYTIMMLLMNIEDSFNSLWKVKKSRNYTRKFADYLALMLITPILTILSSSVTVFITTYIKSFAEGADILSFISPFIFMLIKLIPYFIIWILLTIIYIIMPNTKVDFLSALIAGIISGTAYQVTQAFYIYFQIGVSKYNAIYGSFAALPLFLIWLQLSWLIVLTGSKIAYAIQNSGKYEYGGNINEISASFKRLLSLSITRILVKNFHQGKKPMTTSQIADKLNTPANFIQHSIDELVACRILSETKSPDYSNEIAFQPAQDINKMTIGYVIDLLDHEGINDIRIAETNEIAALKQALSLFKEQIKNSDANHLLKDIS